MTNNDGSTGSCVVAERLQPSAEGYLGLALTAHHVTGDNTQATHKVTFRNGRSCSDARVLASDAKSDIAVLVAWVPADIPPVEIAVIDSGGDVELVGYPLGRYGTLRGAKLRDIEGWHMSDILVVPGFSGGGAFTGGELVGIVSGGWFWTRDDAGRQATWPTRCGGTDAIRRLLSRARGARIATSN